MPSLKDKNITDPRRPHLGIIMTDEVDISKFMCLSSIKKQTLEDDSYIKVHSWKPPVSVVTKSYFSRKWPINFA